MAKSIDTGRVRFGAHPKSAIRAICKLMQSAIRAEEKGMGGEAAIPSTNTITPQCPVILFSYLTTH